MVTYGNVIGTTNTQEVVKYIMVTTSKRVRKIEIATSDRRGKDDVVWKEKIRLILMFDFGQGVRCPGKD